MSANYALDLTKPRNAWLPDLSQLILCIVFFGCLTGYFIEYDTFWHVKTGEWIWTNRQIPTNDLGFSIPEPTAPGELPKPIVWHDSQWIAQLIIFGLWNIGGFLGLRIILALIPALIFKFSYLKLRRGGVSPLTGFTFVLVAIMSTAHHWMARPHLLAYLCILASLYCWKNLRFERHWSWLCLPIIQLLWVNLHQTFALQFLFAGVFLLEAALEIWKSSGHKFHYIRRVIFVSATLLVTTLINPTGWLIFHAPEAVWKIRTRLDEWQPFYITDYSFYFYITYALILLVAFWGNRRNLRLYEPMLFTVLILLASTAARHTPIFVIGMLPSLIRHLLEMYATDAKSADRKDKLEHLRLWFRTRNQTVHSCEQKCSGRCFMIGLWAILLVIVCLSYHGRISLKLWDGISENMYPVKAADFLEREKIAGRVFNEYAMGGYLIYRFGSSNKLFVDGRGDMYGLRRIDDFIQSARGGPGWRDLFKRYNIDFVLASTNWRLSRILLNEKEWALVYSDPFASIFVMREKFPVLTERYAVTELAKKSIL